MDNIREEMEKHRIKKRKKRQRIVLIQRSILAVSALLAVAGVMFLFSRLNTEDGLEETVGVSQQVTLEDGGQAPIGAYDNLGIANVSDYLNIRENPEEGSRIIGRLPSGAGCEIMGTEDGWHHDEDTKIHAL